MRFRRGMTVLERRKYRDEVIKRELEAAYHRASVHRMSETCRRAMATTRSANPELARELHEKCRAEEPGGPGCLCEHHDEDRGGVMAGVVQVPPLDSASTRVSG